MVFLKSLTLNGFKAFAEKTTLKFEDGVCGIIGPNGCGKSNLIDAVKWVVGEQKTSELRGANMIDVIFGGAEGHGPAGMAEVEMVLANETGLLPLAFAEVSVTRRVYRSGDSEYLINHQPVLLRDVQTLFLDTGIGKSSYSIIEQGSTNRILSKNPEERRYLFEEAASIAKYRERKKEYERKIESTRENLVRVQDILREKDKQYTLLKKQAETAEKYFQVQAKIKEADLRLFMHRLRQFRLRLEELSGRISEAKAESEGAQKEIFELDEVLARLQGEMKNREAEIGESDKKRIELSEKINALMEYQRMVLSRKEDIQRQQALHEQSRESHQKERQELATQRLALDAEVSEKQTRQEGNVAQMAALEARVKLLQEKAEAYAKEAQAFRQRLVEIADERRKLVEENGVVVDHLIREIDAVKGRMAERQSPWEGRKKRLLELQQDLKRRLYEMTAAPSEAALVEEKTRLEGDVTATKARVARLLDQAFALRELEKEQSRLTQELLSEKDPLTELIFNAEGTYARKERIDQALKDLAIEEERCHGRLAHFDRERVQLEQSRGEAQREMAALDIDNAALLQSLEMLGKITQDKAKSLDALDERLAAFTGHLEQYAGQQKELDQQLEKHASEMRGHEDSVKELAKSMDDSKSTILELVRQLEKSRLKRVRLEENRDTARRRQENWEKEVMLIDKDVQTIQESAMTQYSENLKDHEARLLNESIDPQALREELAGLRESQKGIGAVNPMAQDEFREVDDQVRELRAQKEDIEASMADLAKICAEIEASSRESYLEVFGKIQKNFHQVFRRLFNGGRGTLEITDPEHPLDSGIDILVQPPGKKVQSLTLYSGGEKSLIAVALMMSIFLVKPSPLCLLDEVDAALDKENINRLARLLHEFRDKTQFIMITHNDKTTSIMDYFYGVTMHGGVTRILSLRLNEKPEGREDLDPVPESEVQEGIAESEARVESPDTV